MKIRISDLLSYLIIIPFLAPRGLYNVVPVYEVIITVWLYLALGLIFIDFTIHLGERKETNKRIHFLMIYFVVAILITFFVQGGFYEGKQKLFAHPILCLYCAKLMVRNPQKLLNTISNILLIVLGLNITFFNPNVMQSLEAGYHMVFVGHVQTLSQYGTLGLFCACLLLHFEQKQHRKNILLIVISVVTMLFGDSDSALLAIVIAIVIFLLYKFKLYDFFCKCTLFIGVTSIILSGWLVWTNIRLPSWIRSALNSRHWLWYEVMELFEKHKLFGYGIQGVNFTAYWGNEMNYAHSQFAQNILDGGLLLTVIFYFMIMLCAYSIWKISNKRLSVLSNLIFLMTMIIALFDSITWYPYLCIVLVLLSGVSTMENNWTVLDEKRIVG